MVVMEARARLGGGTWVDTLATWEYKIINQLENTCSLTLAFFLLLLINVQTWERKIKRNAGDWLVGPVLHRTQRKIILWEWGKER
jgi:hypothetical protein